MINFFKLLEQSCKFSVKVANYLFGETTLFRNLCACLPHNIRQSQLNPEEYPLVPEVINFLNALLAEQLPTEPESDEGQKEEAKKILLSLKHQKRLF